MSIEIVVPNEKIIKILSASPTLADTLAIASLHPAQTSTMTYAELKELCGTMPADYFDRSVVVPEEPIEQPAPEEPTNG